jgi:CRP/FNR family cyclic AMP-dependent transcriptional regulator
VHFLSRDAIRCRGEWSARDLAWPAIEGGHYSAAEERRQQRTVGAASRKVCYQTGLARAARSTATSYSLADGVSMQTQFEIALLFGAIGAVLTVTSNLMKRMVPLRILALSANSFFIVHAGLQYDWINVGLQVALLAVNAYRLWDLRRLLVALEQANADTPLRDWLLPHMKKKSFAAETVLFKKGDTAHELIYIRSGTVRIPEIDRSLGPGDLVGEIGLFSEDRKRTATVVCETDCVCYTMTDEAIYLLYFQNPKLGFYLIRLIVQRLLRDLQQEPVTANV